jgi:hypothetical protein
MNSARRGGRAGDLRSDLKGQNSNVTIAHSGTPIQKSIRRILSTFIHLASRRNFVMEGQPFEGTGPSEESSPASPKAPAGRRAIRGATGGSGPLCFSFTLTSNQQ